MSTKYEKLAVYEVRNAMWKELQAAGLFNLNDYYPDTLDSPLIPIIPSQQVPEFNNLLPGKPYIVYNVVQKHYGVEWWMSSETLILEIISRNAAEIQTITNFLIDLFRRYDQSATDVNLETSINSPFKFHWFRLESADPSQPFQNEGGYMSGDLSIVYCYSREVDSNNNGRFL